MNIAEYIPYGKENAVTRSYLSHITDLSDREVRREIAKARRDTPILNMQDGSGYYRPTSDEYTDVKIFYQQESSRARSIFWSMKGLRNWMKEKEQKDESE